MCTSVYIRTCRWVQCVHDCGCVPGSCVPGGQRTTWGAGPQVHSTFLEAGPGVLLGKLAWLASQLPGMSLTLAQPLDHCWIVRGAVLGFLCRFWNRTQALMPAR